MSNLYYHIAKDKEGNHSVIATHWDRIKLDNNMETDKDTSKIIVGTFGRLDYAEHWKNYHNGNITKAQHEKFLWG